MGGPRQPRVTCEDEARRWQLRVACDVENVALFGNVPTVDFASWNLTGNSLSRSPSPAPPLTLLLRHDVTPSLSRHSLGCTFSLTSLLDAPSSLPTFWDAPPSGSSFFSFLLFFFPLFPLTVSLLLAGKWDPPLAGKREGGLSPISHARPPRLSSAHECGAHDGLLGFSFLFFSFADCPALLSAPSSRIASVASRLRHASPLSRLPFATRLPHHASPSPCVSPSPRIPHSPRVTPCHASVTSLLRHASPHRYAPPFVMRCICPRPVVPPSLRRPSHVSPLSRHAFVTPHAPVVPPCVVSCRPNHLECDVRKWRRGA